MLEVRGMDFESMGMAMGYRRSLDALEAEANTRIQAYNATIHREVAINAGRMAQLRAVLDALCEVAPDHPLLQETGLVYQSGERQVSYQSAWDDAYDAVARARGIPPCRRAMTLADQAYDTVMREPVEERRFLFCRRFFFRGEEHRSKSGAERARRRAAEQARENA